MGEFLETDVVRGQLDPSATSTPLPDTFLEGLIARAEARLKASVARLTERVATGELDTVLVRSVLLDAIVPVATNPSGLTSEAAGDRSQAFSAQAAAARLIFSPADLELLRPQHSGGGIGAARLGLPSWGRC